MEMFRQDQLKFVTTGQFDGGHIIILKRHDDALYKVIKGHSSTFLSEREIKENVMSGHWTSYK